MDDLALSDPSTGEYSPRESDAGDAQSSDTGFDYEGYASQLENVPDDVQAKIVERLLQAKPLRDRVSAESSRAIQRARAENEQREEQLRQERSRAEAAERYKREQEEVENAYDLVLSDDPDIDPLERDNAAEKVRNYRLNQKIRQNVMQDKSVQEWAVRQAGFEIYLQAQKHPELEQYWGAVGDDAPDFGEVVYRVAKAYADDKLKTLEPAIRADEGTRRLQRMDNPDLARSAEYPRETDPLRMYNGLLDRAANGDYEAIKALANMPSSEKNRVTRLAMGEE